MALRFLDRQQLFYFSAEGFMRPAVRNICPQDKEVERFRYPLGVKTAEGVNCCLTLLPGAECTGTREQKRIPREGNLRHWLVDWK